MRTLWQDFKAFAVRGNFVDLAVAVVLGIAFGAVVQSLIDNVVMPLIAALAGEPNFDALEVRIGEGVIAYGTFITALVNFLLIAFVLFLIVRAYQRMTRPRDAEPEPPTLRSCPYCLSDIPVGATRCAHCTSEVEPTAA
jgi:large conductance mechanosensitive channel